MTDEIKNTSIPVGEIRVQMGEEAIVFNPTDDITGKEVSLIMQMFLNGLGYRGDGLIDFGSFIVKHNLQRHFTRIENERKEEQEGS